VTPGARAQAAIELLGALEATRDPADRLLHAYFRTRRYVGGKDRGAIQRLVYGVLRRRAQLDWWIARSGGPSSPRTRVLAALAIIDGVDAAAIADAFAGARFQPAALDRGERALVAALAGRTLAHPEQPPAVRANAPEWLFARLAARAEFDVESELAALGEEAGLDLRVNLLKGGRDAAMAALARAGITAVPTSLSPIGLRVRGRPPIAGTAPFKDGLVEVQDEGSQIAALLVDARPGMRVCDFCAGAGGKTLALAAVMENRGRIVACDTVKRRLEGSTTRLRRAGAFNVEPRLLETERDPWVKRHRMSFDRVLVDAPCSGSGTWRRNPDAKWALTAAAIDELVAKQGRILDSAVRLVKPGGRLAYVTCSLLADENERQVEALLARHRDLVLVPVTKLWSQLLCGAAPSRTPWLMLTPGRDGTDGFFVAIFERGVATPAGPAIETG
jgi:16S rRNA (cytosine967-C5)-methyltransferase